MRMLGLLGLFLTGFVLAMQPASYGEATPEAPCRTHHELDEGHDDVTTQQPVYTEPANYPIQPVNTSMLHDWLWALYRNGSISSDMLIMMGISRSQTQPQPTAHSRPAESTPQHMFRSSSAAYFLNSSMDTDQLEVTRVRTQDRENIGDRALFVYSGASPQDDR